MKIVACMASSADGRIAYDIAAPYKALGSAEDLLWLRTIRDAAQAVVYGGSTFRAYPKLHAREDKTLPLLAHGIVTRAVDLEVSLPVDAPLWQAATDTEITIFTPVEIPMSQRQRYPKQLCWVTFTPDKPYPLQVCAYYQSKSVETLLIEGGGQMLYAFLQEKCLDTLFLTWCPLLLGGLQQPQMLLGEGFQFENAPRLKIESTRHVPSTDELFMTLSVQYPS
ncbi:MAG: dihydrofolate reductase family protein [Cyanobacteria bacterium]|nr:dihydrofolate reductase family protein [Cyanobacteriota bacterium]